MLAETVARNLALEARDGIRRHFAYNWQTVAQTVPAYGRFVEAERARLGEDHPIFQTQYALRSIAGRTGMFSAAQRTLMQGSQPRQLAPSDGRTYVAGLDLAGESEDPESLSQDAGRATRDSTVLTVAELDWSASDEIIRDPTLRIVHHHRTTGIRHADLYAQLIDLARAWRLKRLVVDATGLGQPVASFLADRLGSVVEPFVFTVPSKSRLAFDLLAAVNAARIKMYRSDGSAEHREFWRQIEAARSQARANQLLNFFVPPDQGHDDFLMSLALLVQAASIRPRVAIGRIRDRGEW